MFYSTFSRQARQQFSCPQTQRVIKVLAYFQGSDVRQSRDVHKRRRRRRVIKNSHHSFSCAVLSFIVLVVVVVVADDGIEEGRGNVASPSYVGFILSLMLLSMFHARLSNEPTFIE